MKATQEHRASLRTALYRLFTSQQKALYIGISFNPKARLASHSRTKHWWGEVDQSLTRIVWFSDRGQAEAAELAAIRDEQPEHNVVTGDENGRAHFSKSKAGTWGRPAIGGLLHAKIGADLLAQVDVLAAKRGVTRSQLIREMVERAEKEFYEDYPDPVGRSAGRRIIVSFVALADQQRGKRMSELDPAVRGELLGYAKALAVAYDMPHWGGQGEQHEGENAFLAEAIQWARESEDAMTAWARGRSTLEDATTAAARTITIADLAAMIGHADATPESVGRFVGALEVHDPRTGRLPKPWSGQGMGATFTEDEAEGLVAEWYRSHGAAPVDPAMVEQMPDNWRA